MPELSVAKYSLCISYKSCMLTSEWVPVVHLFIFCNYNSIIGMQKQKMECCFK